ncbi:LptF/LptG family permease [Sulfurovum sp. zt1-1]|uniref:LptF/LptG family permease n=1 Tax=Sulfurovum zhangzhouensis TaxID=3019067 RepID=A0ABT7QWX0_9BACT|nr:LptF/LptG family permease [Sulfurovum zhangzhouensis]MDM5271338.1 LptF/LptG family permease [Sulfurovum zhangzhouensis]
MNLFSPPLYFSYLAKHYLKNLLVILIGLSLVFSVIDYFQQVSKLEKLGAYQLYYIFYQWEAAVTMLYPLAIVFAVIITKVMLVKNSNIVVLHAFGFSNRKLFTPFLTVALIVYMIFMLLHTTEFSYAKERASHLLKNEYNDYQVKDLFFKYNDAFVYVKNLDPLNKRIEDITIFKVEGNQVQYTIKAPYALYNGSGWDAKDARLKTHLYDNDVLQSYRLEYKKSIETLEGYKPKIMESLYEGKALNVIDAYHTWRLFSTQKLDSSKIRATLYDKVVTPLFAIAMLLILFFKMPFHARMVNLSTTLALSLGATIVVWGVLFGLGSIGYNGVILPELTTLVPILLLIIYAIYIYLYQEAKSHA